MKKITTIIAGKEDSLKLGIRSFVGRGENAELPNHINYIDKDESGNYYFGESENMVSYKRWKMILNNMPSCEYSEEKKEEILKRMEEEIKVY